MGMRFDYQHDVDTVYELITDSDFFVSRCESFGDKNVSCDKVEAGDEVTMNIKRTMESDLPKFLAKMFSAENTIAATMKWKDHGEGKKKTGSYKAEVQGQPVTITSEYELVPKGDGCEYIISISAKAKIPLVGKKVEKFVAEQAREAIPQEVNFNKQALAARA